MLLTKTKKKTIENSFENANDENHINYYTSKKLNYYELDFYNESNEFVFYFVTSNVFLFFVCRRYENVFLSNNKFYQYVKIFCLNVQILLIKSNIKNIFANVFKFTFTTKTTKISFNISKSKIIISTSISLKISILNSIFVIEIIFA